MLNFTVGNTTQRFIVTLNERKTLASPYYLFIFKSSNTRISYATVINSTADLSPAPERFNKFQVNVATIFSTAQPGEYIYEVYEQTSSSNTDPDQATGLLEQGRMALRPETGYNPDSYNPTTSFKAYNG